MSIVPYILNDFIRPSRLIDQQFGLGIRDDDFWLPYIPIDQRPPGSRLQYYRPWRSTAAEADTGSVVDLNRNAFEINLDVQHFTPEEITVKANDDGFVIVEARHPEKRDEHGLISRHFVRKYSIPPGTDANRISCSLSSDGVLKIIAPRLDENGVPERIIPIHQTGMPSRGNQDGQGKKEGQGDIRK